MSKRSNPFSADADESIKKARTTEPLFRNAESSPSIPKAIARAASSSTDAIAVGAVASGEQITITTSSTDVAPPRQNSADPAAFSSATASRREKPSDMMGSTNRGSGGNAFLRAQREAKVAAASKPPLGSKLGSNGDERSSKQKAKKDEKVVPYQDSGMESLSNNDANTKVFARREEMGGKNFWPVLLILLLIAANIAAVFYIIDQESMNNVSQMHCSAKSSALQEDASRSRDTMGILRAAMEETQRRDEFLEQALNAQKQALEIVESEGQSAKDGDTRGVSEEGYIEWRGEMNSLERKKKILLTEFHQKMAEFKK